ncbi:hypothetical protein THH46_13635 [Pseudomonas sp. NA13]
MAFSGTLVTCGQASGVVVATATSTEIGHISNLLAQVESLTTPLIQQMNVFARWLTLLILLIAGLLLAYGHFVGHYVFTEIFMVVVGMSVAAIPEGCPPYSPLPWRWACGRWRVATLSFGACRPSKRWARYRSFVRTRPAPSPATR